MGDNKISEALIDVADDAYSQHYYKYDTGVTRDSMRAALEAAFAHLQGEAVPVGHVRRDSSVARMIVNLPEGTPLFAKPQPAELSEMSGGSGELAPVRDRTPTDYAIEHAGYLVAAANQLLEARNELDALVIRREEEDDVDDDDMHAAQESVEDATSVVRLAIHEFEKRRDRALAATGKQQVGEKEHWLDRMAAIEGRIEPSLREMEGMDEYPDGEAREAREQFEAWAARNGFELQSDFASGMTYWYSETRRAWDVWQAAIASRQPVGDEDSAEIFRKGWEAGNAAQGIDLGQFRERVAEVIRSEFDLEVADPEDYRHDDGSAEAERIAGKIAALIDGRDAGTGVE